MKDWYYGKSGQQFGPISESTLRARIAVGEIDRNDLIWTDGMAQWLPLREMPEFFEAPTPPPLTMVGGTPPEFPEQSDSPYAPPMSGLMGDTGGPPLPRTNGLAIASMVCGILSVLGFCFCGGIFLGIPAVICGHTALGQIKASGGRQQGREMAIAGLVCGYIGLGIFILMMLGNSANVRINGF